MNSTCIDDRTFSCNLLLTPSEQTMKVTDCDRTFVRKFVPKIRRHILHDISIIQKILTPNSFSIRTSSL